MKKVLFLFCLIATVYTASAQQRPLTKVDFIGIDFTMVNVVGASETNEELVKVFANINTLMLSEQEKYDVGHYLQLNVNSIFVEDAIAQLKILDTVDFTNKRNPEIDIDKILANYPTEEGRKLLIICEELNKGKAQGKFIAVVFDSEDKEILREIYMSGQAGGFGLRNYWAGSFYSALKAWRKYENK